MKKKNILPIVLSIVFVLMSTAAAYADGCGCYYNNYGYCSTPYYPYAPVQRECAEFVADVTIPDGSYVAPGSTIVKTWRIRNNGSTTWDGTYNLVFVSGNQMGAPARVALPAVVYPGQTVDISVTMVVPSETGSYKSEWMLENGSGARFGVGYNCTTAIWASLINYYQQPTYNHYNYNYNYNYCNNCYTGCRNCGLHNFEFDGNYNPMPISQPWYGYRPY